MLFKKSKKTIRYEQARNPEHDEKILSTLTDDEILIIQEKIRQKAFKKKAKTLGWDI